ncbi:MAG: AAA domain-containing protein [Candidatus Heimdallarchaeota archaeon]|nr:AAA domain-containing protein [Candidatus Heimdallarchaeota archaeon]
MSNSVPSTSKRRTKKRVDKKIFTDYADLQCDRQLFLKLSQIAEDNPGTTWKDWRNEENIIPRSVYMASGPFIDEFTSQNESRIYDALANFDANRRRHVNIPIKSFYGSKAVDKYGTIRLSVQFLEDLFINQPQVEVILVEHQFPVPQTYIDENLGLWASDCRPDIMLIKPMTSIEEELVGILDKDGKKIEVLKESLNRKLAIQIIDIKAVSENNLSMKYVNDLHYYLQIINSYIYKHNLQDRYVTLTDNNGLFPLSISPNIQSMGNFYENLKLLYFTETLTLYSSPLQKIQEFRDKIPLARSSVAMKMSANCDKCNYLDDCLTTCNFNLAQVKFNPNTLIDVLPMISNSVVSQLNDLQVRDINQLANASNLVNNQIPQSINPIIPLLDIKSKSALTNSTYSPPAGSIHNYAIPQYTHTVITFTLEKDPTSNYCYVFAIHLHSLLSTNSNASFQIKFEAWYRLWHRVLEEFSDKTDLELEDLETIKYYMEEGTQELNIPQQQVKTIFRILSSYVGRMDREIDFKFHNDVITTDADGNPVLMDNYLVRFQLSEFVMNLEFSDSGERTFTRNVIDAFVRMIEYVNLVETLTETLYTDQKGLERFSYPKTAVYYWGNDIPGKLVELFEKYADIIFSDDQLFRKAQILNNWINSTGGSDDAANLNKIYNLTKFVEQTVGLPLPVQYTWHRVAAYILPNRNILRSFNRAYWSEYFDSMVWARWYDFLYKDRTNRSESNMIMQRIQAQAISKVTTIRQMVRRIQTDSNIKLLISGNFDNTPNRTISNYASYPNNYHMAGRIWYGFRTFSERAAEISNNELRGNYPEYGVGKLEAAYISNISIIPVPDTATIKYQFRFELQGLSSYSKFEKGSSVYLIPIEMRDRLTGWTLKNCGVTLIEKEWNNTSNCYIVTTNAIRNNIIIEMRDRYALINPQWCIYPITISAWANHLFNTGKNRPYTLLSLNNMGNSWLGSRMIAILQIMPVRPRFYQIQERSIEFNTQEIYMLAPDLLQSINKNFDSLSTQIQPTPDDSQREAILFALNRPLAVLQGPPGTGKSQTIVALIDEYLSKRREAGITSNKILISTFSYSAMNVILQGVCDSKNHDSTPSFAATCQKVYVLGSSSEAFIPEGAGPTYQVDYLRRGNGNYDFNINRITPCGDLKLEDYIEDNVIFFANAYSLAHFHRKKSCKKQSTHILSHENIEFDLIIIDEASQYPVDYLLAPLQLVKSGKTKIIFPADDELNLHDLHNIKINEEQVFQSNVVIVGDNMQLPPVQPIKPSENLENLLGSVFSYLVDGFKIPNEQLRFNYRSHRLIVEFIDKLNLYGQFQPSPYSPNSNELIQGDMSRIRNNWIKPILEPENVIVSLIHNNQYDTNLSLLEISMTVDIIMDLFNMMDPNSAEDQREFWSRGLGIVAPHNAHGKTIVNRVFQRMITHQSNQLQADELNLLLSNTIYSVDKFQGSEREVIIASLGISDKDQLLAEESFIYNRNRLNVLITRAKYKLILLTSRNFLEYIPNDSDLLFDVSICPRLVDYCNSEPVTKFNYSFNDVDYIVERYIRKI